MVPSAARRHRDDAARSSLGKSGQSLASYAPTQHHLARFIKANHPTNVLPKVDAHNRQRRHQFAPFLMRQSQDCLKEGRAIP
jgi:hypothetical protein